MRLEREKMIREWLTILPQIGNTGAAPNEKTALVLRAPDPRETRPMKTERLPHAG